MLRVLDFTHRLLADAVTDGGYAVDATVGNGHDTVHLAERVGAGGHVWGFDIQAEAIAATRARLAGGGLHRRCTLTQADHGTMLDHLPAEVHRRVQAVTFNLGYLPGAGRKSVITRPETTVPALEAAASLLAPKGLLTVVLYTGHPGGQAEADAVEAWAQARPPDAWRVLRYAFVNVPRRPPYLLALQHR